MEKASEKQIKDLLAKHSIPPLEVIIPVLEKAGRGEHQLTAQIYDTYSSLAEGTRGILGLKDKNMKTLAKVWELLISFEGGKIQPIELTESRYSFSMTDCPMLHVGRNISSQVKSKFCDLICTGGSKALIDTILGPQKGTCVWSKALIKGANKCTLTFELVKDE